MKLYMHPASTTSRPVMQFIADNKMPVEQQVVDIFKGEHYGEPYTKINPNRLIPMLEDGDFRLTESATILRYLAQTINSPTYPKELRQRVKVDELLDWFNSNFYRDWGYGLVYPQVFPTLKRADPTVQAGVIAWGQEKSKVWLGVLNDYWLGPRKTYLCGAEVTIADYFGVALVTIGELVHCDFSPFPNVTRWLAAMKSRPSYAEIYQTFNGFVASTKGQAFATL
jgi:glutathione S-transferase